ncbi:putative wall-associated receptor kinase [Trifolium repens]|nr:putative wall-associated receptor kinase [Trifolium repens]
MVALLSSSQLQVDAVASADSPERQALPGCNYTCGNVTKIPYPFGIGTSTAQGHAQCYLDRKFELTCNKDSKLVRAGKNSEILDINLQGQFVVSIPVSRYCGTTNYFPFVLRVANFSISSKENKFITVGCDSYGYLDSTYDGDTYSTGCLTRCHGHKIVYENGTCSGIGCCQVDIPPTMRNITVKPSSFNGSSEPSENCTYSFVVKKENYTFSSTHLNKNGFPFTELPVVIDWALGESNEDCMNNGVHNACKNNSGCYPSDTGYGYLCRCKEGYEGNPYHPLGCTDIDECESETYKHRCKTKANCKNIDGNHTCVCPKGYSGDGTMAGGCQNSKVLPTVLGVGAPVILLFVGTLLYLIQLIHRKRKFIKLKEKFFEQNGGLILEQKLSTREDSSSQSAQIFTRDQLDRATKNFDESLIIGKGGFGTVFKGFLDNKRIVAIKKSKIIDRSQIDQFINEVVVLSQINHRNVVKLLGCCLETEVPLLVYEFVTNGTLSGFIHTQGNKVNNESWKTRLKIAAEVAGALSYLHSSASIPIIHRDVKSDNILLDETNTAKVSDFGASRLVPLDQTEVATMVQGTIGYLDPEYMQTSQLTEKSDVYSFGVVLVELLTGERPFCFGRPEERRSLAMHFLSCLKKDNVFEVIQEGMLNEENKQEIKEVAVLAAKCLRLRGEERPSMKEVAMELEGMRLMDKHSWINDDLNVEESRYLLHESSSSIYETGDSSKHGDIGYDSLKDQVLIVLDDGR